MDSSLRSHFLNLYSMALADSEFDEKEIEVLYKIGSDRGIPKADIDAIILNPATVKFTLPETLGKKIEYLYDYSKMILADGKVEEYELKTLEKFCLKFDFQKENVQSIVDLLIEAARNNLTTSDLINFVTQNS
jgi:uncharacterized tellurite resistance protein B-like protein